MPTAQASTFSFWISDLHLFCEILSTSSGVINISFICRSIFFLLDSSSLEIKSIFEKSIDCHLRQDRLLGTMGVQVDPIDTIAFSSHYLLDIVTSGNVEFYSAQFPKTSRKLCNFFILEVAASRAKIQNKNSNFLLLLYFEQVTSSIRWYRV